MAISKAYLFSERSKRLSVYSNVLSHPARTNILLLIQENEICSFLDVCEHIPLSSSTIARHLSKLRSLKLIETCSLSAIDHDSGYRINVAGMQQAKEDLQTFLEAFDG